MFPYVFGSPQFKREHFPSDRGVAIPNLPPMDVMKKIPFITPPMNVQRQFATIIASAEKHKARMQAHLAELDNLFATLQSAAFAGTHFNGEVVKAAASARASTPRPPTPPPCNHTRPLAPSGLGGNPQVGTEARPQVCL